MPYCTGNIGSSDEADSSLENLFEPVFDPVVPYLGSLPELVDGLLVVIQGHIQVEAQRFSVEFRCGSASSSDNNNVALNFSVSPIEWKTMTSKSCVRGQWCTDSEDMNVTSEKCLMRKGEDFECIFLITNNSYKVAVCGEHVLEFKHRVDKKLVKSLFVDGDILLYSIFYNLPASRQALCAISPEVRDHNDNKNMLPSDDKLPPYFSSIDITSPNHEDNQTSTTSKSIGDALGSSSFQSALNSLTVSDEHCDVLADGHLSSQALTSHDALITSPCTQFLNLKDSTPHGSAEPGVSGALTDDSCVISSETQLPSVAIASDNFNPPFPQLVDLTSDIFDGSFHPPSYSMNTSTSISTAPIYSAGEFPISQPTPYTQHMNGVFPVHQNRGIPLYGKDAAMFPPYPLVPVGGFPVAQTPASGEYFAPCSGAVPYCTPGYFPNAAGTMHISTPSHALARFFDGGLLPNQLIRIRGVPLQGANSFQISLKPGEFSADTTFHIFANFRENRLLRNSQGNGGQWGNPEERISYFPFRQCRPFDILILCEIDQFKVAVDEYHMFEFRHRGYPLSFTSFLQIDGDVTVNSIV